MAALVAGAKGKLVFGLNLTTDSVKPWPPVQWQPVYQKYALWAAWYSGDAQMLADVYAGQIASAGTPEMRFWARQRKEEVCAVVHAPVAGDIAATSARLLFSERPVIEIPGAHDESPVAAAIATQERLNALLQGTGNYSGYGRFREGAEAAAAFGGVFLKINWDKDIADMPLIGVVHADAAIPEFRHGILTACTFWEIQEVNTREVIRTEERYERGRITTQRYSGNLGNFGMPMGDPDVIETRIDAALCRYVPNLLPNRLFRNSLGKYLGHSDLSGIETLMDTIDEILTDWLRDIQLAKGRIIAPEQFFETDTDANGNPFKRFDIDRQAYMRMNMPPGQDPGKQLSVEQFAIRSDEHEKALMKFFSLAVTLAGYSPQSFGVDVTGAAPDSGEAIKQRERKSYLTRDDKAPFWESGIADILYLLQLVDQKHFNSKITPTRPTVTLSDAISPDPLQTAQTVNLLKQAQSASIETRVAMTRPDLARNRKAFDEEVQRIKDQEMLSGPDPMQVGLA